MYDLLSAMEWFCGSIYFAYELRDCNYELGYFMIAINASEEEAVVIGEVHRLTLVHIYWNVLRWKMGYSYSAVNYTCILLNLVIMIRSCCMYHTSQLLFDSFEPINPCPINTLKTLKGS